MAQGQILAFAGSSRRESINRQLVEFTAEKLRAHGATVTVLDMNDFDIPLFGEDFLSENGFPNDANRFYELMKSHRGFLIGCPEYNRSITPLLKNTIDWMTIPRPGDSPLEAFDGKYAGLCATSAGKLGGIRGLYHVADILQSIGTHVIPKMVAVGNHKTAFGEDGELEDKMASSMMEAMCERLAAAVKD